MPPSSAWKRPVALFLTSQTLSLFGSSLVQYALLWFVTLETQSATAITLYTLCGFLPTFLLAPFGGVWADRHDRKRLIILADGLIALATLALALAFLAGARSLPLVLLAAALRALGTAVQAPAVGALLPSLAPPDELTRVNGLSASIQGGIMLLAPMAAGALMTLWPIEVLFFVDVVTAALAIAVLGLYVRVPAAAAPAPARPGTYLEDMRLGFRYLREHPTLTTFFTYVAVLLFLLAPAAFLTPLQVARTFGDEVWRLTAIEIAFSVGMLLGGALVAAWAGPRNRIRVMAGAALTMGVCTVLLGLMPTFALYLAPMALFGLALPFYNTGATVLLQEQVDPRFLGRVFSLFTMLMTSMMPLGMLVFGPLAEAVDIAWLLLGTGAVILALVALLPSDARLGASRAPRPGGFADPDAPASDAPAAPSSAPPAP